MESDTRNHEPVRDELTEHSGVATLPAATDPVPSEGPLLGGAVVGGAVGAVAGGLIGGAAGILVGGAVGAAAGAAIGEEQRAGFISPDEASDRADAGYRRPGDDGGG